MMLVETWVFVFILLAFFVVAGISLVSGILQDQRLEDERNKNDELQAENKELRKQLAKLHSRVSLAKLYIEMDGKK